MPRPASRAVHFSARLNPIHKEEAEAIEIVQEWRRNGVNFKTGIITAILRSKGIDPVEFKHHAPDAADQYIALTESLLTQFAQQLMAEIRNGWGQVPQHLGEDATDEGFASNYTRNFMRSVNQRRQQAVDIDEE